MFDSVEKPEEATPNAKSNSMENTGNWRCTCERNSRGVRNHSFGTPKATSRRSSLPRQDLMGMDDELPENAFSAPARWKNIEAAPPQKGPALRLPRRNTMKIRMQLLLSAPFLLLPPPFLRAARNNSRRITLGGGSRKIPRSGTGQRDGLNFS